MKKYHISFRSIALLDIKSLIFLSQQCLLKLHSQCQIVWFIRYLKIFPVKLRGPVTGPELLDTVHKTL